MALHFLTGGLARPSTLVTSHFLTSLPISYHKVDSSVVFTHLARCYFLFFHLVVPTTVYAMQKSNTTTVPPLSASTADTLKPAVFQQKPQSLLTFSAGNATFTLLESLKYILRTRENLTSVYACLLVQPGLTCPSVDRPTIFVVSPQRILFLFLPKSDNIRLQKKAFAFSSNDLFFIKPKINGHSVFTTWLLVYQCILLSIDLRYNKKQSIQASFVINTL